MKTLCSPSPHFSPVNFIPYPPKHTQQGSSFFPFTRKYSKKKEELSHFCFFTPENPEQLLYPVNSYLSFKTECKLNFSEIVSKVSQSEWLPSLLCSHRIFYNTCVCVYHFLFVLLPFVYSATSTMLWIFFLAEKIYTNSYHLLNIYFSIYSFTCYL